MPRRNFRSQARFASNNILREGSIYIDRKDPSLQSGSLEEAWFAAIACVVATVTTTASGPDLALLEKLLCTQVILPLFSLILDYPVPISIPVGPGRRDLLVNLDVSRPLQNTSSTLVIN